jgi:hypothetical protein
MLLNPPQFAVNIGTLDLTFFFKIGLLSLIFLYAIFTFFVYNKIRALEKIVSFPSHSAANYNKLFALAYFLLTVSLFFLTLVIV